MEESRWIRNKSFRGGPEEPLGANAPYTFALARLHRVATGGAGEPDAETAHRWAQELVTALAEVYAARGGGDGLSGHYLEMMRELIDEFLGPVVDGQPVSRWLERVRRLLATPAMSPLELPLGKAWTAAAARAVTALLHVTEPAHLLPDARIHDAARTVRRHICTALENIRSGNGRVSALPVP